ncbi:MAG: MFS transporter, partial [Myxococcota bacterium]
MGSRFHVAIILVVFFFVSLVTNITGPLIPDLIQAFDLSLTMAALLPFSFFAAYAVTSIPAGLLVELHGEKPVLLGACAIALAGALLVCFVPIYRTAIVAVFLTGVGMAGLQVTLSPLLRAVGGEARFAFNSVLGQLVFGSASFISPLVYSHMVTRLALPWVSIYWLFAAVAVLMIGLLAVVRFPHVERGDGVGGTAVHVSLLRRPLVWLYFVGIFSYVGLEQGLANWMSQYLASAHGLDPQVAGARAVAGFWGAMTAGCLVGLVLLKLFDSRKVLIGFGALALVTVTLALFGTTSIAVFAFPACGFALSVMWSVVFSLALNSVADHHGTFAGILCTGIVGGALLPLAVGRLGDA